MENSSSGMKGMIMLHKMYAAKSDFRLYDWAV